MQYHNSLSKNYLPLFFVLGLLLSFESLFEFAARESLELTAVVLLYVTLILYAEVALLWLCEKLSARLFLIAFCFGLVFNIISLKALFYAEFLGLSTLAFWGVTLSLILGTIFLFEYLFERQKQPNRWVYLSLIVIFILPPTVVRGIHYFGRTAPLFDAPPWAIAERLSSSSSKDALRPWAEIKLAKKPNIYLLSFDSMIPAAVARKYLAIDDLPYGNFVKDNMLNQPRAYSPRVTTHFSLNSLMVLDQSTLPLDMGHFPGQTTSAVSSIAHGNNYQLNTGFSSYFLGKQGPHVDQYIVPKRGPLSYSVLCLASQSWFLSIRFFGVCARLGDRSGFLSNIPTDLIVPTDPQGQWVSKVFDSLKEIAPRDRPQITLLHTYNPIGHTARDYNHENLAKRARFRAYFLERATSLDTILQDLVALMHKIDPTALVMVFGDHGTLLSGYDDWDEKDPVFASEDRHRVELGVLKSKNACASAEQAFYYATETYTTPARTLASLFRCLAESPEQLDQLVDFIDPTEEIGWAEMSED